MPAGPRECAWTVHGLNLAGLSWGPDDGRPVLALHGWLDNAASFGRLGPALEDCRVVAMDLTGHGRSDRRSPDASYLVWDDLPEILGVVDALGWDTFTLLGHSRGAIISAMLAASFPERVERLVMMEGLAPPSVPDSDFPAQLRRGLLDKPAYLVRDERVFGDVAEAVAIRERRGLSAAAAEALVSRGLRQVDGGFAWTADPRLQSASVVKLTERQIQAVLEALVMPVLLLLADDVPEAHASWMETQARRYMAGLTLGRVPGGHHFHMEDGVQAAAEMIKEFLSTEAPH